MTHEVIGDVAPIVATPDYMRARARAVHEELNRQSRDVGKLEPARRREWRAFRDRWVAWYSSGPSFLWGATNDAINAFASEADSWAGELARRGGQSPMHAPGQPSGMLEGVLNTLTASPLAWLVVGVVVYNATKK